jgi:uncharacterized protein (TIGR03437 family)
MRFLFAFLLAAGPVLPPIFGQTYSVATLAGSDWVGDHGLATQALLFQAEGLATDSAGNLYIADAQGHRVRQVSPSGIILTIAGTGRPGFSGDGGLAAAAQLNSPYGLAFDNHGNLYIADLGNARVRRVAPDGTITTVASAPLVSPRNVAVDSGGDLYVSDFDGNRVYKMGPDGALTPLVSSGVRFPTALAVDRAGVLYVADSGNHLIRKFDQGVLTTVAAAATPTGLAFDAAGALYVADAAAGQIVKIPTVGAPASVSPVSSRGLAFGPDGSLYSAFGSLVQHVLPGTARIVAGGGSTAFGDGGLATDARLSNPTGLASDGLGNIYIADRDNNRIRHVASSGIITTIAGTGAQGNTGDGGPATLARLNGPTSVSLDGAGDLYVADTGNHRVREFTPGGIMLAVATTVSPVDTAVDGAGDVYIADTGAHWIYQALVTGVMTPFLDGLQAPGGVALDRDGNLYFTDSVAGRMWRRDVSGTIIELGAGVWANPRGLAVSATGDVFVADSGLGQILRVNSSGAVTALTVDATIGSPWDVAIGPGGTLYVADPDGNRVQVLTPVAVAPATSVEAVNAASLLPGPLAPGMLVTIRGAALDATAVTFAGFPAAILARNGTQLVVQAPVQIAGMGQVEIAIGPAVIVAPVADTAPALFTTGPGQAAALNQDGNVNSPEHPVSRGSWISFYGTGEGISSSPMAVKIGGYAAEVLYSGEVASYPGLFQINVRVPTVIVPGILSVALTVGDATSQSGVAIAVN